MHSTASRIKLLARRCDIWEEIEGLMASDSELGTSVASLASLALLSDGSHTVFGLVITGHR